MDDWRDNKYGREVEYSALEEAEGCKFTSLLVLTFGGTAVCIAALLWALLF